MDLKAMPLGCVKVYADSLRKTMRLLTTVSELFYGAMKSPKPEQNNLALVQFAAPLEILAYDHKAAQYYGDIRFHLEK
jgi:predicted nucleic acid-binding protein